MNMIAWISGWVERLTFLTVSRTGPRDERERRSRSVVRGTITAIIARGTASLTGFITVPLTVRYLGAERYGAWITTGSLIMFFSFTDLGLASSLTNALGKAFGDRDDVRARRYVASSFFGLSIIGVALACGGLFAARPLAAIIFPSVALALRDSEIVPALVSAIGLFGLAFPLTVTNRVLAAYQEAATANLWLMIGTLTNLAAVLAVIWFRGGIPMLVLGSGGMGWFVALMSTVWLFGSHKRSLMPRFGDVDLRVLGELFSTGWRFFIIAVGVVINFQSDNVVIAHFLGPTQVTPYSVTFRLFAYSTLIQMLAFSSFWPAYTEAAARKDFDWIEGMLRKNLKVSMLIAAALLTVLTIFGREIIRLWAGPAAVPPVSMIAWMAIWNLMLAHLYVSSCLLEATGEVRALARYVSLTAILNLALSIVFVQKFGAPGVIAATVLAYAVCSYPLTIIEARRALRKLRQNEV